MRSLSRCASVGAPSTVTVIADRPLLREADLRPAGERRVARLARDEPAERADEVVGRADPTPAREPGGRRAGVAAEHRHAERLAQELGTVARRRDVSRLVEPVRVPVARPREPQPPRLGVHRGDEARKRRRQPRSRARSRRRSRSARACRSRGRGRSRVGQAGGRASTRRSASQRPGRSRSGRARAAGPRRAPS